ncbi:hypothetical protein S40288_02044 [Stachybotrys chartarum IBT 40288]|nr:hypothetical protein S40288_02044 [Stachybotrys chartarum IBT 40288]
MSAPGILFVTMQPKPGLSLDQFHEWYNNEHGPTRLRLPSIFSNGLRYQAKDGSAPSFFAVYDVTSMSHLETETYTTLRANRSRREADTIGQVDVKRYFYDLAHAKQSPQFAPIESLTDREAEGLVAVTSELDLADAQGAEEGFHKWFIEQHVDMVSKIPGWLRTRLFKTSSLEQAQRTRFFVYHDFAKQNGLDGDAHKAAVSTENVADAVKSFVASEQKRNHELFYVFGPAPRDLDSLSRLPADAAFTAPDEKTETAPGPNAVITSYVTTSDSLEIRYRLEGNPAHDAPTVAFCNSLLTSLHMWDPLVDILKKQRPDLKILRYDTRGRHGIPQPAVAATLDMVTDDLKTILDALRIPKLEALIGVSMGGATTLNFALKYPDHVQRFIACDFNAASSPANTQAWKDRIAAAEEDNGQGIKKLAGATVSRWFHPGSMDKPEVAGWMTDMVAANDVDGFKHSCTALWEYDLKPRLGGCRVPGLLVVGEADGKGALVKAMQGFSGMVGRDGVQVAVVPDAGHLPMCEQPQAFWDAIKGFL